MVASRPISERLTQSLVGESEQRDGPEVMKNEWFLGCCDAGDIIDGEECIISIVRGSGDHGKRRERDCRCCQA